MPGAVGFTYARTNDPAPSNGPYAKKTKASAQNGEEMKYYQEGLDFKPKSISKNGGWLDVAQTGQKLFTGKSKKDKAAINIINNIHKRNTEIKYDKNKKAFILPEVKFKGKPKEKGFWEQSRDAYLEEHQDDGLLGALGSVFTYPIGIPKQAMMYGLTGKVQEPTEAMGIRKGNEGIGGNALNLFADPTLYVGEIAKAPEAIKAAGKALGTEEGLLSNAYKYNPWAFKPNPEAYYRGIGKEGMDDILNSGIIRSKKQNAYPEPYFSKGKIGDAYAKGYFAELNNEPMKGVGSFKKGDLIQTPVSTVSINNPNLKLYQKDWLQGYKPIEVPGRNYFGETPITDRPVQQGLPNPLGVLDKIVPRPPAPLHFLGMEDSWNHYSPLNLIPGYGEKLSAASSHPRFVGFRKFGNSIQDVIESQSLRPKGTSMGSKQIMGEGNWAEPGKVNEHYSGVFEATMNPQIEGSNIRLEKWRNRNGIVGTTNEGDVAIPLTDPGLSFNRRLPFSNRYIPIDKDKLINNQFQWSTQLPHLQSLTEKYGLWAGGAGAAGYLTGGSEGAKENIDLLNKYTIDPIIDYTKPKLKEANRQFQDLLNSTQRRNGGDIVKDDMGYWNPENWNSPVEIGSNEITMRDVPFDVLGISDEGDVQYMKSDNPKNYKYKGKKVTEFRMAKNGLRQEQKGLVNLDNLTNFTNYNTKQPGGWLDQY